MSEMNYAAKIAALLAKAESTDSAAEAEALSAAAEKLMLKWGITDAMAAEAAAGATATETIIERKQNLKGVYHVAFQRLAEHVARGLGSLRVLYSTWGTETVIYVIGHESDVDRFYLLFDSLKAQAEGAMKAWWKTQREDYRDWYGEIDQREAFKARRAFIVGFASTVHQRLRAERKVVIEETTGSDLVLVGRDRRVQDAVGEMYPDVRKGRASTMEGSWSGESAGRQAGQRADLRGTRAVKS